MVAFPSHHKTRSGKHCSEKLSSYYILFVMIHDNKAYRSSRCLGEGFDREIFRCERAHLTYKFADVIEMKARMLYHEWPNLGYGSWEMGEVWCPRVIPLFGCSAYLSHLLSRLAVSHF